MSVAAAAAIADWGVPACNPVTSSGRFAVRTAIAAAVVAAAVDVVAAYQPCPEPKDCGSGLVTASMDSMILQHSGSGFVEP